MANPIPSVPPLSSITDPNTRAVLQSIVDGLRVRNGELGDGSAKFLTVADLTAGLNGADGAAGSNGSSGAGKTATSKAAQSVATIIKKLSDSILQSRVWKQLDEKITRIETPEWFQGKFGGAVKTIEATIESSNQAMAQQITTAVTNINGNLALVQNELQATSDLAGAAASSVTTLQTKVGQVDAAAQQALQLSASVDGKVSGTWSVKFDVNGYVAGVALGVDQKPGQPPRSNFVVRADLFAVGSPGVNDVVPFFIQDGKTYIKTVMIQDATIDTAKIANLSVNTLKIADHAVSQSFLGVAAGSVMSCTLGSHVFFGGSVHITVEFMSANTGPCLFELHRDGYILRGEGIIGAASYTMTFIDTPGAGAHTYTVTTTWPMNRIVMNVLEVVK